LLALATTLGCSVFLALYFISNDVFNVRGDTLVFWRSLFSFAFLASVASCVSWPTEPAYYLLVMGAAIFATAGDIFLFNATRIHSASAISRILISRHILLFATWPLLVSGYWARLTAIPHVFYGSLFLISLCSLALFKMRKDAISVQVVKAAAPVIVLLTACDLLFGLGVHNRPSLESALVVAVVTTGTMATVSGLYLIVRGVIRKKFFLWEDNCLKAGVTNGGLFLGMILLKAMSVAGLENPGYFGVSVSIFTLWIYLLHRFWFRRKEVTDPRLGFVVVICSVLVAMLAVQVPR
jgi:hypothetical protein